MDLRQISRWGRTALIASGIVGAFSIASGSVSIALAQGDDPGAPGVIGGGTPQPKTPNTGGPNAGGADDQPSGVGRRGVQGGAARPGPSPIVGPGRSFGTLREYLFGLWQWRNPRGQYVRFWFYRNGSFRFLNLSTQLGHYGTFRAFGGRLYLTLNRSCSGRRCRANVPPRQLSSTIRPQTQTLLLSASERWYRLRRY